MTVILNKALSLGSRKAFDSAVNKSCYKPRRGEEKKIRKKDIDLSIHVCWFQSLVTLDGNKLLHVQKWDGKETSLVREVDGNGLTLVSITCLSYRAELLVCL